MQLPAEARPKTSKLKERLRSGEGVDTKAPPREKGGGGRATQTSAGQPDAIASQADTSQPRGWTFGKVRVRWRPAGLLPAKSNRGERACDPIVAAAVRPPPGGKRMTLVRAVVDGGGRGGETSFANLFSLYLGAPGVGEEATFDFLSFFGRRRGG